MNKDCQRTAKLGEEIIYIDTPDGKKGGRSASGLQGTKPFRLIKKYQENFEIDNYAKTTGIIATSGLLVSSFYRGDKKKHETILFSQVELWRD